MLRNVTVHEKHKKHENIHIYLVFYRGSYPDCRIQKCYGKRSVEPPEELRFFCKWVTPWQTW